MTYGEFKTLIASYLHRSDLTSQIPGFVELGRIRLTDSLRVPEMEATQTILIANDEGPLDEDLVEICTVKVDGTLLLAVNFDQVHDYSSESVYAVYGSTIVAPGCSSVDMTCFLRPETLLGVSDSATRPLLTYYPQLWLQAALIEAYRFLDDSDGESKASTRLIAEVDRANARGSAAGHGGAPTVSSPYATDWSPSTR